MEQSEVEVLERKNQILKRKISDMILRKNKHGLNNQEKHFMQKFIHEYHCNCYQLK